MQQVSGNLSQETLDLISASEKKYKDKRRSSEGSTYQIKELRTMHHEILRLAVLGLNNKEIAATVGITDIMVSMVLNSEISKRQLEVMQGARNADTLAVREEIAKHQLEAVEVLAGIMNNENASDRNRIACATDLLDRGGHAAIKTIRGEFLTAHLTPDDIEAIKDRARLANTIAITEGEQT